MRADASQTETTAPAELASEKQFDIRLGAAALLVSVLVVLGHWPALNARATWLDDSQYLLENKLVLHPSVDSTWRFISEVFKPSSVRSYYQPLTMISLML